MTRGANILAALLLLALLLALLAGCSISTVEHPDGTVERHWTAGPLRLPELPNGGRIETQALGLGLVGSYAGAGYLHLEINGLPNGCGAIILAGR
jgi:hypothetical protein